MTNIERENKRLLDVVDEEDNVISSESRTKIHQLGLLHREVHIWMFDKDKNVFFQKRGLHRPSAGLLDATVGGHVNRGEDYLKAAIREAKEEIGMSLKPADLLLVKKFKENPDRLRSGIDETINNFIRTVYLYKHPVDEKMLKKETGVPRGGFQKLSYDFLTHLDDVDNKELDIFDRFIAEEEIPLVLKYLA